MVTQRTDMSAFGGLGAVVYCRAAVRTGGTGLGDRLGRFLRREWRMDH